MTFYGSDEPLTITACRRPDSLGLNLKAVRADGLALEVLVADGKGTLQLVDRPGSEGPGAKVPARVSAGPDGALYLDFEVNRATVACG
jgi:hypothetical protein